MGSDKCSNKNIGYSLWIALESWVESRKLIIREWYNKLNPEEKIFWISLALTYEVLNLKWPYLFSVEFRRRHCRCCCRCLSRGSRPGCIRTSPETWGRLSQRGPWFTSWGGSAFSSGKTKIVFYLWFVVISSLLLFVDNCYFNLFVELSINFNNDMTIVWYFGLTLLLQTL